MNAILFIFGAAVGSAATWAYVKKKYERIAQEEIDSVKEVFSKKEKDDNSADACVKPTEDTKEYAEIIHENEYINYSKKENTAAEKAEIRDKSYFVYVITPEEFGEFDEYDKISLTYYDDDILADENDEIIEDIDETVGSDSLTHFGEYEDDSVFVRNDERKCDYEILLDHRNYSDVIKKKPHSTEV